MSIWIELNDTEHLFVMRPSTPRPRLGEDGTISFSYHDAVEFQAALNNAIQIADKAWPAEMRSKK